jgi:hypothetical protein
LTVRESNFKKFLEIKKKEDLDPQVYLDEELHGMKQFRVGTFEMTKREILSLNEDWNQLYSDDDIICPT